MRKPLLFLGALFAAATLFTSCTKDLKNDVKDLKKQTEELKKHNDHLQGQIDSVKIILGANEPITATTIFKDDANATRTITQKFNFKSSGYNTHYLYPNANGTYDVWIQRYGDINQSEGAYVYFTYNPTTKAISNAEAQHYWDDADDYNDYAYYWYAYTNPAPTMNIIVEKLDVTTGEISVKVAASGTGIYTYNYGGPNEGKEVSTTLSFIGKLQVLKRGR